MLFTIYMGKLVGSRFGQMVHNVSKIKCGKFHPGITFTIFTNQFHLPKNSCESLKLVSKVAFKKWKTIKISMFNILFGKTWLP